MQIFVVAALLAQVGTANPAPTSTPASEPTPPSAPVEAAAPTPAPDAPEPAAAVASAAGTIAPLWASQPGSVAPEIERQVRDEVRRTLAASGFDLLDEAVVRGRLAGRDPSDCRSNDQCFSFVGITVEADYVVLIQAASIETDLVVVLQAIASKNASVFAQQTLQASTLDVATGLRPQIAAFAQQLDLAIRSADPFAAALPPSDAPTRMTPEAALRPNPTPPGAVAATAAAPQGSRAPAYVAAGGTIAAAAITAALVASGASASSCLNGPAIDGHPSVCVPRAQAQALEQRANGSYSAAMVSGAVALALGAATVWLW